MPTRLNLDIFGEDRKVSNKEASPKSPSAADQRGKTEPVREALSKEQEPKTREGPAIHAESPKFVPVGFHAEHLRMLDEAVLRLRRQGHWKASKSAIIRDLLSENENRLGDVFLGRKKQGRG